MEIQDLYKMIPEMKCIPNCTLCCKEFGVPSRTPIEDALIKDFMKRHKIEPSLASGTTCPYVTESGCSIYPVRPLICRLYGTSKNYPCIKGVVPLFPLDEDQEAEILNLYLTLFGTHQ